MIALLKASVRATLVCMVTMNSASAETNWDTLRRFGLTGVWGYHCDNPATRTNYFETYADGPNGLARREVDRGIEIPTAVSFVEDAQIISPSTLKAKIRNADPNWGPLNNLSYDVILTKQEDPSTKQILRFRFLQAIRSDGKIMARDGIYFGLGRPTAWEYKCRTSMSAVEKKAPEAADSTDAGATIYRLSMEGAEGRKHPIILRREPSWTPPFENPPR
jgi:hypothetical protein